MKIEQIISIGLLILSRINLPKSNPPEELPLTELYRRSQEKIRSSLSVADNMATAQHSNFATHTPTTEPTGPEIIEGEYTELEDNHNNDVSKACISCSRSHLSTASGALSEAIRFARSGGITDPEAFRRIDMAENEINIMERIDLSPAAIQAAPVVDRQLARNYLPRIRELRQHIGQIKDTDSLEEAAAEAEQLSLDLKRSYIEAQKPIVNKVFRLAEQVKNKEITVDQAQDELKAMGKEG